LRDVIALVVMIWLVNGLIYCIDGNKNESFHFHHKKTANQVPSLSGAWINFVVVIYLVHICFSFQVNSKTSVRSL
jgi:hypothetical protein